MLFFSVTYKMVSQDPEGRLHYVLDTTNIKTNLNILAVIS